MNSLQMVRKLKSRLKTNKKNKYSKQQACVRLEGPRLLGLCCSPPLTGPITAFQTDSHCGENVSQVGNDDIGQIEAEPHFATNLLLMFIRKLNRDLLHRCCYDNVLFFFFMIAFCKSVIIIIIWLKGLWI